MSKLVIVESPAKCGKIQEFLGTGWRVLASLGHIRHLKEDLDSVGLDRDFEASWEFMKEKSKAISQLQSAAASAKQIYLASDDDREGELIAYSVALLLKLPIDTTPRAVFHEITKTAVTKAIESPRHIDRNKVNAAQARAILDMMVGFTISPLLWKSIAPALSAGRCQTPALRLVADREKEIQAFKSASSWKVHGIWRTDTSSLEWPASLTDELEDEDSARTYLDIHHTEPKGRILTAETKPWSESAPLPLITSTLQQQVSTLFRCAPKRTMQIAQRLYEAGHITYMRTDKAVLSEEAKETIKELVRQTYGDDYIRSDETKASKKKTTKQKEDVKAQEAHEAIRPTHFEVRDLPSSEDWNSVDRKVYQLIWLRAVQSMMASVRGQQRTISFVADGDDADDFQWRASWRKTTFEGWRKASTKETTETTETVEGGISKSSEEKEKEESQWDFAETLKPGMRLTWTTLTADPHETKAPSRYTEASLIRELETRGIGRPSTFAALISTILEKNYVEIKTFESREQEVTKLSLPKPNVWPPEETVVRQKVGGEKDRLAPTALGLSVIDYCTKHFNDLFEYGFTAQMESRLDSIAEGTEEWKQVLRDTWGSYKTRYEDLKKEASTVNSSSSSLRRKEFGNGLVAVMTKKGPLLLREDVKDKEKTVFYGWPSDYPSILSLTEEAAIAFVEAHTKETQEVVLGEHEGYPVRRKTGKFGMYAEWNGKTTSCQSTDTLEMIVEKFKSANSKTLRVVGQFEIREGPYGPYMFKHAITGPRRTFVSVPRTVNLQEATEVQLIAIFQHELQNKARSGTFGKKKEGSGEDGSRGGRGGRGGFRGRGRGRST